MTQNVNNVLQETSANTPATLVERLEILKEMYEKGLITQQEYDEKRNKILNEL